MFYYCIGKKIKALQNTKLEVHLGEMVFKLDPKSLSSLDTHISHIV